MILTAVTTEPSGTMQLAAREQSADQAKEQRSRSLRSEDKSLPESVSAMMLANPVVGSGTDSILFNFDAMLPHFPYVFSFLNHWMIGVADGNGGVGVYYIPNPDAM